MFKTASIRVLLVAEDEGDYRTLGGYLAEISQAYQLDWVRGGDEGLQRIAEGRHDVVLLDQQLGRMSGLDVLWQALANDSRAAFVFLTARTDRAFDELVLRAGAADHLVKPQINAPLLDRAIRYALERRRVDDARRESEERFRLMANAVPALLYVTDAEGRGTFVNQSWLDFRGSSFAEECGDGWLEGMHPEDRERAQAHFANAVHQRSKQQIEYRFRRSDGEYRWMLDIGVPRFLPDGTFTGYVGSLTDITERKHREQATPPPHADSGRNSHLMLQFLANMGHEIRTPMNGIIGMSGLLLDTTLTTEQRELAEIVQKSADTLLGVVNDILDLSKIEAGNLRIEETEFDLCQLIEDTLALFAERADDKGLELACEFSPGISSLLCGDPGCIRQVLANLVGNAIKFTERGEVLVHVAGLEKPGAAQAFRIEVRDTGIGITAEAQRQLFQPFLQADGGAATRHYGGTGLGLAIARQLIELMGGSIGVKSEPSRGSTFWCELSLPKLSSHGPVALPAIPAGMAVLVVDDNATTRRIITAQLAQMGIAVEAAVDAADALTRLQARQKAGRSFQAALLDHRMPGEDGVALAQKIRSDIALRGTKLIMLTSASHLGEAKELRALGIGAFLIKPVRAMRLRQNLSRLLASSPVKGDKAGTGGRAQPRRESILRALVVEDNFVNQKVAQRQLEKLGHRVEVANNGARALEMLALQKYDVVIMDCQMPILDGYETTRCIRAGQVPNLDRRVPIIALTAYAMESDRQKCLAAGMNEFISKPIRYEELKASIERVLAKPMREASSQVGAHSSAGFVVLDLAQFERLTGLQDEDDPRFLANLIDLFLRETPKRIRDLAACATKGDARATRQLAHTVKGACDNFGGRALQALCLEIEECARAGNLKKAAALIGRLEPELACLAKELNLQKERLSPP
ncbi:MAG: response regulator [Opitutaceae bacterium]|jgi:PAS domain S-box-containing protein